MTRLIWAILLTIAFNLQSASAQQGVVWVQIEAHPSLNDAQARLRAYAGRLPDVNGFALGGGWYGIALGPYTSEDAQRVLSVYRSEREIPADSFIAYSSSFQQQIWPVGANLLNLPAAQPTPTEPQADQPVQPQQEAENSEPEQQVIPSEESRQEALRGESRLTREERMDLQRMLQWAGVYDSGIDGAFGRGTRSSMAAWQEANNFEVTGVLTTRQRAELLRQYNAILDGLGLKSVADATAGITIDLPTDIVSFSKYNPPFAHYEATDGSQAKVILISQRGDQNTLFGLYDIMQTLEIVPENGSRERRNSSFTLVGEGSDFISYTEASLEGGVIKGFTLVWPAGDEERRTRMLGQMQASFTRTDGVMDPAEGANAEQSIDLVSGLEIRKPKLSRTGFFVDKQGTVLTTAEAVAACDKITIDTDYEAEVIAADSARGIAVLRAREALAPAGVVTLRKGEARLQSEIALAGFSYEGALDAPTLTFGKVSDIKGLNGEPEIKRLALAALPGDAGGPVFDESGAVMGMLMANDDGTRRLPEGVSFVTGAEAIGAMLKNAGIEVQSVENAGQISPEELFREAQDMTVLVSCW